jgi:uncharacterized membrane protein
MKVTNRRLPVLLAAVGLLSSVVLEVVHYRAYTAPAASSFCTAGEKLDCTTVALSRLSVVLGIPLPVWGAIGFLSILVAAWRRSKLLVPLTGVAAAASVVLLGAELLAIHSVCLLCEVVHVVSFALFAVAWRGREALSPFSRADARRILDIPLVLAVLSFLFVPEYWKMFSWRSGVHFPRGSESGHPWIGAEHPKVTIHEYTDYSCPHCALAASRSRRLLAEHPAELRLVRRQYPRMFCVKLERADSLVCQYARAALCAEEQGRFWEMDSWLFEHAPGRAVVDYDLAAREVNLDATRLKTCMAAQETFDRVDKDYRGALRDHIVEIPTYFIGGKRYDSRQAFAFLRGAL